MFGLRLVTAVSFCLLFFASCSSRAGSVNLLYNGSFEKADPYTGAPDGWLRMVGVPTETPDAPDGSMACLIDVRDYKRYRMLQDVSIEPGKLPRVDFSCWCKIDEYRNEELTVGLNFDRRRRAGEGGRTAVMYPAVLSDTDGEWKR